MFVVVAALVACHDDPGSDDVGETAGDGDGDMGDGDGDPGDGDGDPGDGDGDCTNPDADGDGHLALACDGDDCDDNDPYAYPGYAHDGWEQLNLQPFGGGGFWRNHVWLTGPDNLSDIIFTFNGSVSHVEQESENLWDGGSFVAMGSESRAALGPAGEIHVVFAGPGPNNAAGIYHTIAGSGMIETLEELPQPSVAPFGLDIVVEPDGRIHVVYGVVYQAPPPNLKYATSTGDGNWTIEIIDDDAAGFGGTVKLDSSGVPHVSYSSYDGDEIMHAVRDGAWSSEVVATGYEVAATSLAIDAEDQLHMAVSVTGLEDVEDEFYYVGTTGGTWGTPELIDADVVWWDQQGTWDYRAAIVAGSNGQVHIAYHDEGAGILRYKTRIDGVWAERMIDQDDAGWYPQLVLADGLLHISEGNRGSGDYRRYSFAPDDGVDNDCDGTVD